MEYHTITKEFYTLVAGEVMISIWNYDTKGIARY